MPTLIRQRDQEIAIESKSTTANAIASTVISVFRPISDRATAEMMIQLYDKMDESLPHTIRKIKLRKIHELRVQNKVDHPFSWGGFFAPGDWR